MTDFRGIAFEGIGLKNVVYFKNASAKLNTNPLTFVRGSNLDADPATPTGNGSGKSLFFGAIPTVAYASPPTSTRKKAKKEILGKGSEIEVSVNANGHHYRIVQTPSKYTIYKDGEDIQIRTVPLAEEYIRNHIFPLAEIEYYTHGYISTLRPYLMRSDTDANRLDHFSNIFRLNSYDDMKSYFSKSFRSVKDNEVRLSVLEQKAVALRGKLKKVRKNVTSSNDVESARAAYKELDKVIQKLVQREFDLVRMKEVLKTLQTIEKELDELRAKYTYKDHPSKRLEILKAQKALAKKWDSYNSLLKAYKKNIESTQKKLDELELPRNSRKELETEQEQLKEQLSKLEEKIESAEEARDEYNRLTKKAKPIAEELEELGVGKKDEVDLKADYQPEIDSLRTQLRLKKLIEHDHLDGNSCPTCMSEIDIKNIKRLVDDAKKKLPKLEKKQRAQELYREIQELRFKIKHIEFDEKEFAKMEKRKDSIESDIEKLRESIKVWKRHAELKGILDDIEKPKPPKDKLEVDLSYDELDEQIDLCTEILSHVQSKTKLLENNPELAEYKSVKAVKAKIEETQERLDEIGGELSEKRKKLAGISEVIEKQAAYKSELDLYTKEYDEVKAEIAKLKPAIEDKKILEVLLKAYSSKGLKVLVANEICAVLETNLNHYRHLIFAEPFTFSIHASETGLSIKVDRGNGFTSDVRNLSGAESNCFSLLFFLSILPLIPAERRLNMVVLDEPSAHMDAVTRQLFVERFLPALMEVVPHVYVITPNDEYLNGSSEWIVRKSRGVASLITEPHKNMDTILEVVGEAVAKAAIKKAKKSSSTTNKKSKGRVKAAT